MTFLGPSQLRITGVECKLLSLPAGAQVLDKVHTGEPQDLQAAAKHLQRARRELQVMQQTAGLAAAQVPGFNADVNRRRMAPAPPRPIQVACLAQECAMGACCCVRQDLLCKSCLLLQRTP